jgi:hypothetical protein
MNIKMSRKRLYQRKKKDTLRRKKAKKLGGAGPVYIVPSIINTFPPAPAPDKNKQKPEKQKRIIDFINVHKRSDNINKNIYTLVQEAFPGAFPGNDVQTTNTDDDIEKNKFIEILDFVFKENHSLEDNDSFNRILVETVNESLSRIEAEITKVSKVVNDGKIPKLTEEQVHTILGSLYIEDLTATYKTYYEIPSEDQKDKVYTHPNILEVEANFKKNGGLFGKKKEGGGPENLPTPPVVTPNKPKKSVDAQPPTPPVEPVQVTPNTTPSKKKVPVGGSTAEFAELISKFDAQDCIRAAAMLKIQAAVIQKQKNDEENPYLLRLKTVEGNDAAKKKGIVNTELEIVAKDPTTNFADIKVQEVMKAYVEITDELEFEVNEETDSVADKNEIIYEAKKKQIYEAAQEERNLTGEGMEKARHILNGFALMIRARNKHIIGLFANFYERVHLDYERTYAGLRKLVRAFFKDFDFVSYVKLFTNYFQPAIRCLSNLTLFSIVCYVLYNYIFYNTFWSNTEHFLNSSTQYLSAGLRDYKVFLSWRQKVDKVNKINSRLWGKNYSITIIQTMDVWCDILLLMENLKDLDDRESISGNSTDITNIATDITNIAAGVITSPGFFTGGNITTTGTGSLQPPSGVITAGNGQND